ncbi:TOBE domain-containing protein [Prosthecochloris sp. N3]|uniref:TOBE domain-containing protein n=1 Tax=Prosthecochloris ethylica TaxID=2743976 RepID=A0ABR9XUB1_9CHLB|nr:MULTISPECIES: TOBE domain-containing protein [Prosthecochloris]MBF0585642.1 TOBE domain-containing protein [Prosthecochloris ethylica]MBF0637559.1 TOBE domain-containing protein [Prosthecochloris ethylica]NUK48560.1 TOBE domain-containing protein [Prosthecochloris ethylica]RNA64561.1 LysR family transcriptional regulator [Prosthecochloris sp. ZM_2]
MPHTRQELELEGSLWFQKSDHRFLGSDRIQLLEQINELGSISKAAKAVGISYKTAWQVVNTINNLSERPLVDRTTGGKDGGGTKLTPEGKKVIRQYHVIEEEHRTFLHNLEQRLGEPEQLYQFLNRISMKVSARNIFSGTISRIVRAPVNAEVTLTLKGGIPLTANVTSGAIDKLGLREGMSAYAIIKSSAVIIGREIDSGKVSTRNVLCGTVERIVDSQVNTEVELDIGGGNIITSIITHTSADTLELTEGAKACAMFKASSVIIGVS